MSLQGSFRGRPCEQCEEFFRVCAQIVTGVQVLDQKRQQLLETAMKNEFHFLEVRSILKSGDKDGLLPEENEIKLKIDHAKRFLRELEYIDQCMDTAIQHADCFEIVDH